MCVCREKIILEDLPDDGTIKLRLKALDLAESLTATLRAALVVGVELGSIAHAKELFGECLADEGEFVVSTYDH